MQDDKLKEESTAKQYLGYVSPDYLEYTATKNIGEFLKRYTYSQMQLQKDSKALDLGCGNGNDTIAMGTNIVGSTGEVIGIDYDKEMVEQANRKAEERSLQHVKHQQLDIERERLPFPEGHFDGVRCERVFQHLKEPKKVLEELVRVCKNDGWIVVVDTDHSTRSIDTSEEKTESILRKLMIEISNNGTIGRQLYRFFNEAKLKNIQVTIIPSYFTNYQEARTMLQFDKLENLALERGLISEDDLLKWRAYFDKSSSFFAYGSMIVIAGQKTALESSDRLDSSFDSPHTLFKENKL